MSEIEQKTLDYFRYLEEGSNWIKEQEKKTGQKITYVDDDLIYHFYDEYEKIAPDSAKQLLERHNRDQRKFNQEQKLKESMGLVEKEEPVNLDEYFIVD